MSDTILETVHGSHLYGLNHSDSDRDVFRVVSGSRTYHRVSGDLDETQLSLERFLSNVFSGSHQSCEALFSPVAYVHPHYRAMFSAMRVTGNAVFNKYRRTIHKFAHGTLKQQRHAVRLGMNLRDLRTSGRFNPVLSESEKQTVMALPNYAQGEELYEFIISF